MESEAVQMLKQTCGNMARELDQMKEMMQEQNNKVRMLIIGSQGREHINVPTHDTTTVTSEVKSSITSAYNRMTKEVVRG